MRIAGWKRIFKTILFVFIFAVFIFRFFDKLDFYHLSVDEHEFIRRSSYFDLFFIKRDFKSQQWQGYDAYDQPKIANYLYGLTLHLVGYDDLEEAQRETSFNLGWDGTIIDLWRGNKWWLKSKGALGSSSEPVQALKLIRYARRTAVLFGSGCLFIIFLLGRRSSGFLGGILAVLILGFNPLLFEATRHAMGDSILLFFLLLNALLILKFLDSFNKGNKSKMILLSILVGINAFLAIGTKLNGGMTLIFFFLFIFALLIIKREKNISSLFLFGNFLLAALLTFSIFTLFHPYLYSAPASRFFKMIDHRVKMAQAQQVSFPEAAFGSLFEQFQAVFQQTLMINGEWNNFKLPFLDLILFLTGFCLLLVDKNLVVSLWIFSTFVAVGFYIPLNWSRYYLPLIPCAVVAQAYAISRISKFIFKKKIMQT